MSPRSVEYWPRCSPSQGQHREVGLPPGCILVTRRQKLRETVPTANSRLEAEDRITAVVSPQASSAIPLLWDGCESANASRSSEQSPRAPDLPSQFS
jgi:hypothetical protein